MDSNGNEMSTSTQDKEFLKYEEIGDYHWIRTHDTSPLRRGVRLIARYNLAVRAVSERVEAPAEGIDIGCGDAFLIYLLTRKGYVMTGVDSSRDGLSHAERRLNQLGVEALLIHASALDLPVDDESKDFVTSVEVIEHLQDTVTYLQEARRVLKAGGIFVCTTPQREPDQKPDEVRDPYHVREYIADELEAELSTVFENVCVYGAYPRQLDSLYRPGARAGIATKIVRLGFRLLTMVGMNPYEICRFRKVKRTHGLLLAIGTKPL